MLGLLTPQRFLQLLISSPSFFPSVIKWLSSLSPSGLYSNVNLFRTDYALLNCIFTQNFLTHFLSFSRFIFLFSVYHHMTVYNFYSLIVLLYFSPGEQKLQKSTLLILFIIFFYFLAYILKHSRSSVNIC